MIKSYRDRKRLLFAAFFLSLYYYETELSVGLHTATGCSRRTCATGFQICHNRCPQNSAQYFCICQHRRGRLLVGVKDNGKIAGVRSEEEIYMIEAAATMYCQPKVEIRNTIYNVEGKNVLEVQIAPSEQKPVYALDEQNKPWAYVRIKDENILATPVHLQKWLHDDLKKDVVIAYTEQEQAVLNLFRDNALLTLNQCCKLSQMNRKKTCQLIADFIRFDLLEEVFDNHKFYFRLKTE